MFEDPKALSLQLALIAILTLVNAYFAASEMAIVSVNKTKIQGMAKEGNKNAVLVEKLLKEPTSFLSTIQIAITLAGFFNSASAATGISVYLADILNKWHIPYGNTLAVIIVTIILSFLTLVFGELVPKRIALQNAEKFSMLCARPILAISKIASPFIKILSFSTRLVLRLFGMHDENVEESLSREEIRSMVKSGQENGVFNATETEMIDNLFEFEDIQAEEIMTPRTDAFCIEINDPLESYINDLMSMHYTRIPVYDDKIDNIIGILNLKDLFIQIHQHQYQLQNVNIRSILRKPYFVLETKNIDTLFKEMQINRQHIAILIDEYGGFSGIVTLEDLIEQITGAISDEFDMSEEHDWQQIDERTFMIDGLMPIAKLNDDLGLNLESDEYDTISGFLLSEIGHIFQEDMPTSINYNNLHFDIIKLEDKHIETVKLTISKPKV